MGKEKIKQNDGACEFHDNIRKFLKVTVYSQCNNNKNKV
jgi:hypothetical protein